MKELFGLLVPRNGFAVVNTKVLAIIHYGYVLFKP